MASAQALAGIRILDFTRVLAGPFCTMLLADFGADVIKVERPGSGDETRQWGPPWVGTGAERLSAYYASVNRNKRSITLNLHSPEGAALARALALQSDVLVENFKVGQMQAYGLDYAALREAHPGLIYCSITGYGQTSPQAAYPGYDFVIQGESGLMAITGPENGEPYKVGVAIADVITGLTAANAIQTALLHRHKSGEGQYIDIALLDSQLAALVNVASNFLVSGQPPARYGNAHPNIVPYEVFQASDQPFVLAVGNDAQFQQLCALLHHPEWAENPKFKTNPDRVAHREILLPLIRSALSTAPASEWIAALRARGIPAGPVNDVPLALNNAHVQARQLIQEVPLPDGTPLRLLAAAAKLSTTPAEIRLPPPTLGAHTEEILTDLLGLDPATLAQYRANHNIL